MTSGDLSGTIMFCVLVLSIAAVAIVKAWRGRS